MKLDKLISLFQTAVQQKNSAKTAFYGDQIQTVSLAVFPVTTPVAPAPTSFAQPATPPLSPEKLAGMIDHTALKPETTPEQIRQLCREAREYKFASVCINPGYVELAASELQGSTIPVCSVIGFPLGTNSMELKALETRQAVAAGAREIDMVIHVGQLKAGNTNYVRRDIESVVKAAEPEAIVKVILETCLLTDAEIVTACELAAAAGANFVKTSTGFNKGGATCAHVALMRKCVGTKMGVKAAGGIRDYATAAAMITAGASRIGASAGIKIISGAEN